MERAKDCAAFIQSFNENWQQLTVKQELRELLCETLCAILRSLFDQQLSMICSFFLSVSEVFVQPFNL